MKWKVWLPPLAEARCCFMITGMSAFSFYRFLREQAQQRGLTMRVLGAGAESLASNSDQVFTTGVRAMLHWCKVNEMIGLERHHQGAHVYAGFERLSRVAPVQRRYQQLGERVERLVLFGQADATPPVCAQLVDVGEGPLSREWFLLVQAPGYRALLAARDMDGFGPTGPLAGRRFEGVTVQDERLIDLAAAELERVAALLPAHRHDHQGHAG